MKLHGSQHTSMRKWKKEEVVAFLQHSYSKFKYRNVGLISQMSYELQLPFKPILQWTWEDIYMLIDGTWDENLVKLIDKQKEVFGFQPLVAPQILPLRVSMYLIPSLDSLRWHVKSLMSLLILIKNY